MKTRFTMSGFAAVIVLGMLITAPVCAVKPAENLGGAQEVSWYLSGDVMPVPPYGSADLAGSDTSSKLIVNQPNGNTEVALTGVMNGLSPNTEYTVFLSKDYEPYEYTGWDITGTYGIRAVLGGNYDHDYTITVQDNEAGTFSGTGGYPMSGPPYSITETVTGTINPMTGAITWHTVYNDGYWADSVGTIASDGSILGTWGNTAQGYGHTWYSIAGTAHKTHTGDESWPGLFTSTVPPFTFTTDEFGSGSWHVNLRDANFAGSGTYPISVWINGGGRTVLISDNFNVVVG